MTLAEACSDLAGRGPIFGNGLDTTVVFEMPDVAVGMRLHDGKVEELATGTAPDVVLRWVGTGDPVWPSVDSPDPFAAAHQWHVGSHECTPGLIPPVDQYGLQWTTALPSMPGVDFTLSVAFKDTPFGVLYATQEVKDGQVVSIDPVWDDTTDVWFRFKARRWVGARAGRFSIPEVLEDGGECSDDIDLLMLVAGLEATPAWQAARHIAPERERAVMAFFDLSEAGLFAALAG